MHTDVSKSGLAVVDVVDSNCGYRPGHTYTATLFSNHNLTTCTNLALMFCYECNKRYSPKPFGVFSVIFFFCLSKCRLTQQAARLARSYS